MPPVKFTDPVEFRRQVEEYFTACQEAGTPPNISGLCVHLDTNRQCLQNYEDEIAAPLSLSPEVRKELGREIKRAHERCAQWLIDNALVGKAHPILAIFLLKNHGYTDRQEIDNTHRIEGGASEVLSRLDRAKRAAEGSE